jgi:4-hydroxy-4-methyl-2-oxoglutarate aldolase
MRIEELRERIIKLDVAAICDSNKQIRIMDVAIKPLRFGMKLFGIARTVTCSNDFLTVVKALQESSVGEVLVIDSQSTKVAVAGELFTTEALRKGLAGIVTDGSVRDTPMLRTLNLPIYSRFINPMAGTATKVFETQVSITCGGVKVNPGDILFGDDEGIIVTTIGELTELLPLAEEIQKKEASALLRMKSGESLFDMLNLDEHFEKRKRGEESNLKFG